MNLIQTAGPGKPAPPSKMNNQKEFIQLKATTNTEELKRKKGQKNKGQMKNTHLKILP